MNHVVPGRRSDSTDPRAIRTRNALVQATIGLLKTHTVAELNVSQIVKEAGVSRQVFYQHFTDRDGLVLATAQDMIKEAYEGFAARFSMDRDFQAAVTALTETLTDHYEAAVHIIDSPVHGQLDQEVVRIMLPTMREALREREGADPQLLDDMAKFYIAGCQHLLEEGVRQGATPEEIGQRVELVRRVLIHD
ncbi:TetR/AcrR family transcriptional regulator [uncultured Corynebacterium sp.]|uniref:TetR/AcrR family transcriptional regulator n=1 Tax=uncultured Corynebacterium sp. TaxID=159447 RepID=UPI00259BEF3B|nr:TetR/AcrR family transcriptional regulator [uncultured Corynebacterium sp.]